MNEAVAPRSAAILISGSGSNLQAIVDAVERGEVPLRLAAVISDRPDAFGLERARRAGVAAECVPSAGLARSEFESALSAALARYRPDFILLAGFMRILTAAFVNPYAGRMLNIHPSLLPRHAGLETHRRVLEAGDRWHGCTVHFVTQELDGGPPVIQARLPVQDGDDAERLAARVLALEHRIYPHAAALLASGRLTWRDGAPWLDGARLRAPLQWRPD